MTAPEPHESPLTRRARRSPRAEELSAALGATGAESSSAVTRRMLRPDPDARVTPSTAPPLRRRREFESTLRIPPAEPYPLARDEVEPEPEPASEPEPEPENEPAIEPEPEPRYLPMPPMPAPSASAEPRAIFRPSWTPSTTLRPVPATRGHAQSPVARPSARRAARAAPRNAAASGPARHARTPRRLHLLVLAAAAGVMIFGGSAAVTSALTGSSGTATTAVAGLQVADPKVAGETAPPAAQSAPVIAAPAALSPCDTPEVTAALAAGDDAATIAAIGGAAEFRQAVATGQVPCISLADPARVWVVVNKMRPLAPLEFEPAAVAMPAAVRSLGGGALRTDAAAALDAMVTAAAAAGVGEVALESGYRSYATQVTSYGNQVQAKGQEEADLVSARPGFSEHQSGLAADVVACGSGCGTLDDFAATPQGQWTLAHAWEYGWIVRYDEQGTGVTGYRPEPWHLRYIGTDLARAYHQGGWHTLEEFFGLEPAPGYVG